MEENEVQKDFYSIKQFAKKLDVHENTIRRAIKNGRISAFRVGAGKKATFRIAHSEIGRIALFDLKDMIKKMLKEEKKEDHANII